ncbi:MAG TPA: alpha/beta hydrolase [Verrucomicrobiae bacterium]|nr:alpha/beta hydrolase [Verrucomicrobiae bacterium]
MQVELTCRAGSTMRRMGNRPVMILRVVILCSGLALVGGCALVGPPREVYWPRGVIVERDVTYATVNGRDLRLDLYRPEGSRDRLPVVVWVHGGGWFRGSRYPCPVARLATRGYIVAAVEYRLLSTDARFPAPVHDLKAAVRWLRHNAAHYQIDPDHIGVWGSSAGGMLACMLGLTAGNPSMEGNEGVTGEDSSVKCVVAFFPMTDLPRLFSDEFPVRWEMRTAVKWLLGGVEPKDNPVLAQQASPIYWVHAGAPPHLVIHGGNDHWVPAQHSVDFVESLLRAGVDAHAYIATGYGHGIFMIANVHVRDQVHAFLDKYLKSPAKGESPGT